MDTMFEYLHVGHGSFTPSLLGRWPCTGLKGKGTEWQTLGARGRTELELDSYVLVFLRVIF